MTEQTSRAAYRLVGLVVVAGLVACGGDDSSTPEAPSTDVVKQSSNSSYGTPEGFWHGEVDGIECIAIANSRPGNGGFNGISCDWSDGDDYPR